MPNLGSSLDHLARLIDNFHRAQDNERPPYILEICQQLIDDEVPIVRARVLAHTIEATDAFTRDE